MKTAIFGCIGCDQAVYYKARSLHMAKDYLHIQKKKGRTSFCSAQIKCFQNKLLRIKRKSHNISLGCLNVSLSRPFPPFIHSFVCSFSLSRAHHQTAPFSSRTSRFKCIEFPVEAKRPPQPLITAIGRSLIAFLLMPASWQVFTTSVTFLYESGACGQDAR